MKQLLTVLLLFARVCLLIGVSQTVIADDERLIKAAFVFNFAKLTSWPENTWSQADAPLMLCTAGRDQLVDDLKQLEGRIIKGHPVSIRPLENGQKPHPCHVLYIASSEKPRLNDILTSVTGQAVLTISELPYFVRADGIIELYRDNNRTRFMINLEVARKMGLEISSRLLSMAIVVVIRETP